MKRFSSEFMVLALAASLVGCGSSDKKTDGAVVTVVDMATSGTDGSVGGTKETGEACTKATECAGTRPTCSQRTASGAPLPGGSCTSTCKESNNGAGDGLNTDCPSDHATCAGGTCVARCSGRANPTPYPACRDQWLCYNGPTGAECIAASVSGCDPTADASTCQQDAGVTNDAGEHPGVACVQYGADPFGLCEFRCDVFAQNCQPDANGAVGCVADLEDGSGTCIAAAGGPGDGEGCNYLNSCGPGLQCNFDEPGGGFRGKCRKFCRTGANAVNCAVGTCVKLNSMSMLSTDVAGLCKP